MSPAFVSNTHRTYRKTSCQGLLEPQASRTHHSFVDFESRAAADDLYVGKISSFQELQVAGPQTGVLTALARHACCHGALMHASKLVVMNTGVCRYVLFPLVVESQSED